MQRLRDTLSEIDWIKAISFAGILIGVAISINAQRGVDRIESRLPGIERIIQAKPKVIIQKETRIVYRTRTRTRTIRTPAPPARVIIRYFRNPVRPVIQQPRRKPTPAPTAPSPVRRVQPPTSNRPAKPPKKGQDKKPKQNAGKKVRQRTKR